MTPVASNGGQEEETTEGVPERRCRSNTIDRTTTTAEEAAILRATLGGSDGKKSGCSEPHTLQGSGIGTRDTGTVPGVGTATAGAGMTTTASGLRPPIHEMPGTFGKSAEVGLESHTQTINRRMTGAAEAVLPESGIGAFHARCIYQYLFKSL